MSSVVELRKVERPQKIADRLAKYGFHLEDKREENPGLTAAHGNGCVVQMFETETLRDAHIVYTSAYDEILKYSNGYDIMLAHTDKGQSLILTNEDTMCVLQIGMYSVLIVAGPRQAVEDIFSTINKSGEE